MGAEVLTDIKDPEDRRVLAALLDPKWDYRTIDGLVRASGLPRAQIVEILEKYQGRLVEKSQIPDIRGRDLFRIRATGQQWRALLDLLSTFITKSVRS